MTQPASGLLEIRQGGGALAIFGLPFLAAGVFLVLGTLGFVTVRSEEPVSKPAMVLLESVFTIVGAVLSFGRVVATLDLARHVVIRQWRLLLPIRSWTYQLSDYRVVTIGFIRGDSDSADRYPVGLKPPSGPALVLCTPTQYAQARECAAAVARFVGFDVEDRSTDHAVRVAAGDADAPLTSRLRSTRAGEPGVARPPEMRSDISETGGGVRIAMPMPRLHPLAAVGALFPAVMAAAMLQWLGFFGPRPLRRGEWIFFGVLFLGFAVLPAAGFITRWLRSRVGRTIVTVSGEGLRVEERRLMRTHTIAAFSASEILDVDYSTKESALASARRNAEAEATTMRNGSTASSAESPAAQRVFTVLGAFIKGQGIIVKTRNGLTTFGEGLPDAEIRYLHDVIRRALAGGA